jgi:HK97 family phage portal protein
MNQTEIIVSGSSVAEVVPQISGALSNERGWLTAGLSRSWDTDSGQRINAETSLTYSSVFQACSLISQGIASLGFEVFTRTADDDRERLRLHPAWGLLNISPSPTEDITAFSFRETMTASALLHGNGYAAIGRGGGGRPTSLTLLNPQMTWPDDSQPELMYWTQETSQDEARPIPARDVFHLKGLSPDGLVGYSVFKLARNSWGLGLAQEKHGARHFRNGSRPNIALRTTAHLDEDQATSLRQRFESRHRGLDAETSTAVLSGGLEIVPFSISNEDSQWLQSRAFQRVEVASWFNLPPHMLGSSEGPSSYNSLQEENRRFLQQTLRPWLNKWQSEADLKLLTGNERDAKKTYFEHNLASLIEADTAAVTEQVTKLIASEVISVNEARRKLNMNKRADGRGDEYRNPAINPTVDIVEDKAEPIRAEAPQPEAADPGPCQKLLAERLKKLQATEAKQLIPKAEKPSSRFEYHAKRHYENWTEKVTEAVEPFTDVFLQLGYTINAPHIAAAFVGHNRQRVLEVFKNEPRNILAARLRDLFNEELADWPQQLASDVIGEAQHVQD